VLNIDESRARVKCPRGEHVIVLAEVIELYTASPENKKSITVVKTIITDKRKPLPPFVIAPRKQIIDNWINKKLISKERIAATLTGYTNNEVALQYINYLIKHSRAGPNKL
jgi:hypothetical protein